MVAGILAFEPPTARNTPKYLTEGFGWNPIIGRPMTPIRLFTTMMTPRTRYRSPTQAVAYIRIAENAYGGAIRHWDAARLKFKFSRRIIGRKSLLVSFIYWGSSSVFPDEATHMRMHM